MVSVKLRVDVSLLESQEESETTFLPEAAARFPGIVGQTVVLGSAIAAIAIWSTRQKYFGKDNIVLISTRRIAQSFQRLLALHLSACACF